MSDFNNIFENKIIYEKKFTVDLAVKSGYTIDYGAWHDRSAHDDWPIPWHLLSVTVTIDHDVLYQGPVDLAGLRLSHVMLDTDTTQSHSMTIAVSGFSSAHSFYHDGQEINAQLMIEQFKIEHLDLLPLISQEGHKIFTESSDANPGSHELLRGNHAQVLHFSTPIYPWLLSKFSSINHS